jgi:hypothetical protein
MKRYDRRLFVLAVMLVPAFNALALDAPPPAFTGRIMGQVVYGKDPAARITITLEGPDKKVATSDAKGEFVFNDLPAGEYRLSAEGRAKNNIRKGTGKATVVEGAAKPAPIIIKLN